MRKAILPLLMFVTFYVTGQEKKTDNLVDKHVLAETLRQGNTGLKKTEMSEYASEEQMQRFLKANGRASYYTFPEPREKAIRILDGMTAGWTAYNRKRRTTFQATVQPGEFFTFQVGVYAHDKQLGRVDYSSSGLEGITCFNLEGIDHLGEDFRKEIKVEEGAVEPLWFGLKIPVDAKGNLEGEIVIQPQNMKSTTIKVKLLVTGDPVENNGYNDGDRLSRLAWLNSQAGHDENVTKGYIPLQRKGTTFYLLGRSVEIGPTGLPKSINTYFDNNNQSLVDQPSAILSDHMRFVIETSAGKQIKLKPGTVKFVKETASTIKWEVTNRSDEVELIVKGMAEFDGFMDFGLEVKSLKAVEVKDIRLEIPMTRDMSEYMMGMHKEGGFRPDRWAWKWDVDTKSQDAVWVGGVNGGLRIKLKDENYHRQLVNVYYEFNPLILPKSWGNESQGGCKVISTSKGALIKVFSGERRIQKGQSLHYDFELLITPVKLINRYIQYNDRYYHSNSDVSSKYISEADRSGANIINIHHKKDINPFINYPYLAENLPALTRFVEEAHAKDIRTKVYYTTRELTVNTPEIWAMRSLNGEVIFPGPGSEAKTVINPKGPHQWLVDNFKDDFLPAWKCTFKDGPYKGRQDLSVITVPDSRMNNFYLQGLDWMCQNMQIDGIYIDDSALDRVTMKRARKILDASRPKARIDMHTWNHFNDLAGYACCLNLYMDLLPYYDQLWIGEGRDYDRSPDYWLVETAGIPFGVTSQMLQHGGNPWRGMVFGITNRLGWYGSSPEYIWQFWDDHTIQEMEMIGFWDKTCPVQSDNPELVATLYKGKDKMIVAVANWSDEVQKGHLTINWNTLGINKEDVQMYIPYLQNYQDKAEFSIDKELSIEGSKGYLIVIQ
ncbi:MAG: hypothetical protein JEZ14_04835 [Marinilabiliaceae bacterium]|nr:hypothetical protein [Marinilabiliaceae bacterium]